MTMTFEQQQQDIRAAIARFPETFGLRNYHGTFRISERASYFSEGTLLLYTQVKHGEEWLDFCKGTERELRAQIVIRAFGWNAE